MKSTAHASTLGHDFPAKNSTNSFPQAPGPLDQAQSNFFLFSRLELPLRGRCVESTETVKSNLLNALKARKLFWRSSSSARIILLTRYGWMLNRLLCKLFRCSVIAAIICAMIRTGSDLQLSQELISILLQVLLRNRRIKWNYFRITPEPQCPRNPSTKLHRHQEFQKNLVLRSSQPQADQSIKPLIHPVPTDLINDHSGPEYSKPHLQAF